MITTTPPSFPGGRISQREMAKHLGVSHATVSMALRGHHRVSEAVRARVLAFAEEMGYRPDPALSALNHYRIRKSSGAIHSAIAWVNAWPRPEKLREYKEFDSYWRGASAAADKFGFRLEEFRVGHEMSLSRLHQILSTRGIRGIILPPHSHDPDWGDFPWQEYSVVRFGRSLPHPRTHLVTADQVANTMVAFREMLDRGYQRIGFATDERNLIHRGHLFEGGYLTAQRMIPEAQRLSVFVVDSTLPERQQVRAMEQWLAEQKPDAVLSDLGIIRRLIEAAGRQVPRDIALAATSVLDVDVDAGIDQHPEEIGRVGFLMLYSLLNDRALGIPKIFRQILVEGGWIEGESLPGRRD